MPLLNDVPKGQVITWADVRADGESEAVKIRRYFARQRGRATGPEAEPDEESPSEGLKEESPTAETASGPVEEALIDRADQAEVPYVVIVEDAEAEDGSSTGTVTCTMAGSSAGDAAISWVSGGVDEPWISPIVRPRTRAIT